MRRSQREKIIKTSRIKELNTRIARAVAQLYKDETKRFVNTISTLSTPPTLTNSTRQTAPSVLISTPPPQSAETQPPTTQAAPLLKTASVPAVSTPQILEPLLSSTSFPPTKSTTPAASVTVVPVTGETTETASKVPTILVPATEAIAGSPFTMAYSATKTAQALTNAVRPIANARATSCKISAKTTVLLPMEAITATAASTSTAAVPTITKKQYSQKKQH